MRSGMWQQPQTQPQLSQAAIDQVRGMMSQVKNASNPQAVLANMLQNNSNLGPLAAMVRNGGSLENIAKQMAAANGLDINQIIQQLQGGL